MADIKCIHMPWPTRFWRIEIHKTSAADIPTPLALDLGA